MVLSFLIKELSLPEHWQSLENIQLFEWKSFNKSLGILLMKCFNSDFIY